jgi:diguanylate cyclase (GGDEF)-like protein
MSYDDNANNSLLVGVLALGPHIVKGGYSNDDQTLILSLADQVGTAIHIARLIEEKERNAQNQRDAEARQQLAETLRTVTGALTSTLNLTEVIERLLESLAEIISYDSSEVMLIQGNEIQVIAGRGNPVSETTRQRSIPLGENALYAEILRTRQPIVLTDAQQEPRFVHYEDFGIIRGWIGVPLIYKDEVIGLLSVDSLSPGTYGQSEADITFTFAGQAAIAIENARLFGEVQRLATTDSLTGIHTRRHFFSLAEQEFKRSLRYGKALSAIMLDVDHFKHVNDNFGHAVGDAVLIHIAACCVENIRQADILGRYGGEEFAIILPETDLQAACEVAERLRQNVARSPIEINRESVSVTVSLGVATLVGETRDTLSLLSEADDALYAAKSQGRNRVCTASQS